MRIKIFLLGLSICISSLLFSQLQKQEFYNAIVRGDITSQKEIAVDLKKLYSSFTYSYYELLLNSLPSKAVLITNSLDDTYPIKILQLNRKIRSDIRVVSIKMLNDSTYVNTLNKLYNLKLRNESSNLQIRSIFSTNKNSFFSSTVKNSYWYKPTNFISGLYIQVGSKNSKKNLDAFYKDFSKLKLKSYQFTSSDRLLLKNILPPLITLYKNGEQSANLKKDILMIADIVGNKDTVIKILDTD